MRQEKFKKIKELTIKLNEASEKYYNGVESGMSDSEWDSMYNELKQLEEETNFYFSNSPTHNVGAPVLDKINKVKLTHPMLSLKKVYTIEEIANLMSDKSMVESIKLDGLSLSLTYESGILLGATTRGNGEEGSDVSEAVKYFENIPQTIDKDGTYIIDGEAIITQSDFEDINSSLPIDARYSHSRNLAAGTLSLLDMNVVKTRHMRFIAWDVIEGDESNSVYERLNNADMLGFETVPRTKIDNKNFIQGAIEGRFAYAEEHGLPCDGIVWRLDDISYGKTLGRTSHHFNNGVAYKRKTEEIETTLLDIEWQTSKTGLVNPVAIFKEVDLGGALTTKATLHNLSYIEDLELGIGDTITVTRRNEVIPKVMNNLTRSNTWTFPSECPCCGSETEVHNENGSKTLHCTNSDCKAQLSAKLVHAASKNALNIENMSESTIEFLVEKKGWLKKIRDIYTLDLHWDEWIKEPGFGEKSVLKLLENIAKSKQTTLQRVLYAQSIPLIGKTASKDVANHCQNDIDAFVGLMNEDYDFTVIDGFGFEMQKSLSNWWKKNRGEFMDLLKEFTFESTYEVVTNKKLENLTFVITGSLNNFDNRTELQNLIESLGGKVSGSISAKTNYLINNDVQSGSSKNQKAQKLNVSIISEEDFLKMIN